MLTEQELKVLILRKDGLLQIEIAKRLNITQGAVSRFEANAKAKIAEARKQLAIIEKLGITTDESRLSDNIQKIQQELRRSRR